LKRIGKNSDAAQVWKGHWQNQQFIPVMK